MTTLSLPASLSLVITDHDLLRGGSVSAEDPHSTVRPTLEVATQMQTINHTPNGCSLIQFASLPA
jgi:hypothetical protein